MKGFLGVLRRDLLLAFRQGVDVLVIVMFFVAAGALFAFAIGSSPERLAPLAAGIVLVMAALAALLSLDKVFQPDLDDGSLDQMLLAPLPLEMAVLAKVLTHWLSAGLPLLVTAAPLAMMLGGNPHVPFQLVIALALTTPAMSLLGVLGAALTLGARRGGLLLVFLVLPLFVPVLIFGAAAAQPELMGQNAPFVTHFVLLALNLFLLSLVPWAAAAALRQAAQ